MKNKTTKDIDIFSWNKTIQELYPSKLENPVWLKKEQCTKCGDLGRYKPTLNNPDGEECNCNNENK